MSVIFAICLLLGDFCSSQFFIFTNFLCLSIEYANVVIIVVIFGKIKVKRLDFMCELYTFGALNLTVYAY